MCTQIHVVLGNTAEAIAQMPSSTYADLVHHFHDLLSMHPIIIFVDSLDQLRDENEARSKISFLDGLKPHNGTRVIVSTLPDDLMYNYGCFTRLKANDVCMVTVPLITHTGEGTSESAVILQGLLMQKGRRLTPEQMAYAIKQSLEESTALYFRLLCIVCGWLLAALNGKTRD
jgi:hypothetical protein